MGLKTFHSVQHNLQGDFKIWNAYTSKNKDELSTSLLFVKRMYQFPENSLILFLKGTVLPGLP
jgi:hypothetical protein